jgi:hypothetical protein
MSNSKISALTSASTPLVGTEVLPIVQSGVTKQVANNDLRPKQIQSNATSGVLQIAGPSAASTRVATVPDANWTAARTDAAQSFTGDQTLATGNLIQGTAAKGINFTANTPAAGMTSQLLNWYEEGNYTPTITAFSGSLTTYTASAKYTRIGRQVTVTLVVSITTNGTAATLIRATLPFTNGSQASTGCGREETSGLMLQGTIAASGTYVNILTYNNGYPGGNGTTIDLTVTYFV